MQAITHTHTHTYACIFVMQFPLNEDTLAIIHQHRYLHTLMQNKRTQRHSHLSCLFHYSSSTSAIFLPKPALKIDSKVPQSEVRDLGQGNQYEQTRHHVDNHRAVSESTLNDCVYIENRGGVSPVRWEQKVRATLQSRSGFAYWSSSASTQKQLSDISWGRI